MGDTVPEKKEQGSLKGVITAGVFFAGAAALFIYTSAHYNQESYWQDYFKAYRWASGAALIAGALWLVFALLKARTNFFDLDRKIDSDEFNTALAVVIIAVIVALSFALMKMPSMVPKEMAGTDSPDRTRLVKLDRNLKILVSSVIILGGLIVLSAPLRRLRRKDRLPGEQPGKDIDTGDGKKESK